MADTPTSIWRGWRASMGLALGVVVIAAVAVTVRRGPGWLWGMGVLVALALAAYLVHGRTARSQGRLRQRLMAADYRLCFRCCYDLAALGTDTGVCPECGEAFIVESLRERWAGAGYPLARRAGGDGAGRASARGWKGRRMRLARIRRVLKWAGVAACIAVAGVWGISRHWTGAVYWVGASCSSAHVAFGRLSVTIGRMPPPFAPGPGIYTMSWWDGSSYTGWFWPFESGAQRVGSRGFERWVTVPLYAPFALLAAATVGLAYMDRRAVRQRARGECLACGYSLSGLPGCGERAVCPECGSREGATGGRG